VVIGEKENQAKMKCGQVEYSAAGEHGARSWERSTPNPESFRLQALNETRARAHPCHTQAIALS
jgi:hypothetical protein